MPTLRDYQEEDVKHLLTRDAMGIFNEQRTGKTPTALTVMLRKGVKHLLIVCPATLIYNWYHEVRTWMPDYTDICIIDNINKFKKKPVHGAQVYIINYEGLRGSKKKESLSKMLLKEKLDGLIVDEAHRCKNRKGYTFESIKQLHSIKHRLYLTGTPAHDKPWDVWAILHFIEPNLFRSYWKFIDEYFKVKVLPVANKAVTLPTGYKLGMDVVLQNTLNRYACNRKRADVMDWGELIEDIPIKLPLTKAQQKYIKSLEDYFEVEDIEVQGVLDRITRIRQICAAPELLGLKGNSPKIDWVLKYFKDYPDIKPIIFSNSTKFLQLLASKLTNISTALIIGEVDLKTRKQCVQQFQENKIQTLLIQTQAGKEGLTLDKADSVIFIDVFPPMADYTQARDRIVATVPENVKPKQVINLIMEDSYDESLYNTVLNNIEFTSLVNDYKKYIERRNKHGN